MPPKEYFRKLIELYSESRETKYYNPNIFRGRSSSISSQLEDLTALFIALNNPDHCTYYIDQPVRFGSSKTRYPDIVIQNGDKTIENLIDVKADIGWNRDGMYKFCMEWEDRIKAVQGTETTFTDGKSKEKRHGKFSKRLKYHVLIATLENSGKTLKNDHDKIKNECSNVNLYLLSDGQHPNTYGLTQQDVLDKINIQDDEFRRFFENLKDTP
ncbi:hypothetical protein BMS3Abin14_01247 [bacterium BMS3Abin14]|nr:hypothetical protein BMS3Abin14_01247 [bacterium BMS3Abin14]